MLETRLSKILALIFLFALIMGPGPGLYLVNPSPDNPSSTTFLGIPVLITWSTFWFFVQAVVVLVAYRKLWTNDGDLDE